MAETLTSLDELRGSVEGTEAAAPVIDVAPREPQRDALGRSYATGKRKDAVARVWIKPGSGKVVIATARASTIPSTSRVRCCR